MQGLAENKGTKSSPSTVVVLGPLFLDIVLGPMNTLPKPGQELWVENCAFIPGGSANQAIAASRLGLNAKICAYLGKDSPGNMVKKMLEDEGIDTSSLIHVPHQSVTVSQSVGHDRAMTTCGTNQAPALDNFSCPEALIADLRGIMNNRRIIQKWRESENPPLVIADVGWDDSGKWDLADLEDLSLADYFLPNEDEALHYTRCDDVKSAAHQLQKSVPNVVITRGAKGVFAFDGDTEISLPAVPVTPIDPTGAGDTFAAMLTWAALKGLPISEIVSCASLAASWSVQGLGGSLSAPTHKDLRTWTKALSLDSRFFLDALAQGNI